MLLSRRMSVLLLGALVLVVMALGITMGVLRAVSASTETAAKEHGNTLTVSTKTRACPPARRSRGAAARPTRERGLHPPALDNREMAVAPHHHGRALAPSPGLLGGEVDEKL